MAEDFHGSGTFEEIPFPVLLKKIRDAGQTGILLAQKGEIVKRVFFQNGVPVVSRSNIKKELLGEILCARGKLTRAQLDEAILESKKESGDNFGQILTKKGFLSEDEIYTNSKYQFVSILFSLFPWNSGTYSFFKKEAVELIPAGFPRFHVPFSKLISEGMRLMKKEELFERILGEPEQFVHPTSVTVSSDELSFMGEDRPVLEALGRGGTIQDMIGTLPLEPVKIKKVLSALFCLGAVEFSASPREESSPPEEETFVQEETGPGEVPDGTLPVEEPPELLETLDPVPDEAQAVAGPSSLPEEETGKVSSPEMEIEEDEADEDQMMDEKILSAVETAEEPQADMSHETMPEEEATVLEEMVPETDTAEEESVESDDLDRKIELALDEGEEAQPETEEEESGSAEPVSESETAPLTPEAEAVLEDAVEQEAEAGTTISGPPQEEPSPVEETATHKTAGRKLPLVLISLALGIVILFGAMALFYYLKAGRSIFQVLPQGKESQPIPDTIKTKTPDEIIAELASEEGNKNEKGNKNPEAPSVPVPGKTPPGKTRTPEPEPVVVPAPVLPKPAPGWKDFYAKGLSNFKDGNLESAFLGWAEAIRSAPDRFYSIQVEVTTYLNYASHDLQASSPDEKVFIVKTLLHNKPAYKVLCGIFPTKEDAEKALHGLTPYLKAQKPALVRLSRLKARLIQ